MLLFALVLWQAGPAPLVRAHAHNDYAHARPLQDALDQGFCSVEADVFFVEGKLLVGHNRKDLQPGRTLEALYLGPLAERLRKNRGSVYPQRTAFTLLVDIKADPASVYTELKRELRPIEKHLTRFDGRVHHGAITAILSGERPIEAVRSEPKRVVFIDGRLPDLEAKQPPGLYPLISESFESISKWEGKGALPATDQRAISRLVGLAHKNGQRLRFWATPDTEETWRALYDLGVDLINTDDLTGLSRFLQSRRGLSGDGHPPTGRGSQARLRW